MFSTAEDLFEYKFNSSVSNVSTDSFPFAPPSKHKRPAAVRRCRAVLRTAQHLSRKQPLRTPASNSLLQNSLGSFHAHAAAGSRVRCHAPL